MNAGYRGIFLLIDNKDTAADSVPQQGTIQDHSYLLLFEIYEHFFKLLIIHFEIQTEDIFE